MLRKSTEPRWTRARAGRRRGFTLIEAIVSLILLVAVMMLAMTLLFTFRTFAERQQFNTTPRQASRRALDYLGIFGAGAGDLNVTAAEISANNPKNPNALVMFYNKVAASPANRTQASYDNLPTASTFGDEGTDLISLTIPTNAVSIDGGAANTIPMYQDPLKATAPFNLLFFNFQAGCPINNRANMDQFKAITGFDSVTNKSAPLLLVDGIGKWLYVRIADYQDDGSANPAGSICANRGVASPDNIMQVQLEAVPGLDTPGGHIELAGPLNSKVRLLAGTQNVAFRVRNKALQQKIGFGTNGLFDPLAPDTGFTTVLDNVEDFQVAYLFQDGTFRNTASTSLTNSGTYPDMGVPQQAGPCGTIAACTGTCNCTAPTATPDALDVANVVGLRLSIIGRSNPLPLSSMKVTERPKLGTAGNSYRDGFHVRPPSENHAAPTVLPVSTVVYDYYRITTTLAIRNRLLEEPPQ